MIDREKLLKLIELHQEKSALEAELGLAEPIEPISKGEFIALVRWAKKAGDSFFSPIWMSFSACGCMGPQNGDPVCPCQMRSLMIKHRYTIMAYLLIPRENGEEPEIPVIGFAYIVHMFPLTNRDNLLVKIKTIREISGKSIGEANTLTIDGGNVLETDDFVIATNAVSELENIGIYAEIK